jgi:hypothetical protein
MRRIEIFALVCLALVFAAPELAHAQNPDPADLVKTELVGTGYDVTAVGFFPDSSGQPRSDAVYAQIETITNDLGNRYLANQAIDGFEALNRYYPNATTLISVLHYDHYLLFFQTTPQDLDPLVRKQMGRADFWPGVRTNVHIYDTAAKEFVGEKDFVDKSQIDKNQTGKDFSGQSPNVIPTPAPNDNVKPEHILLEPSTTYLPADGATQAFLLASLSDANFNGLGGRAVDFAYEVQGQDEKSLGSESTDAYGTARANVTSSQPLDQVLLRASTTALNAAVQIVVGAPPGASKKAQVQAVVQGLTNQGYSDVDAESDQYTGPAGQKENEAVASVRVQSKSFDRAAYSQLIRSFGTLRTVMPDANLLIALLLFRSKDGHDYTLVYSVRPPDWDAFVDGQIGEVEFWQRVAYNGAVDENGNRVGDKNFLDKNFGASGGPAELSSPRSVQSTLTAETWGEQLNVGAFQVPIGGSADGFSLADSSGSAAGFELFATPDYTQPIFHFSQGDNLSALSALQLAQGQYILQVEGAHAPARVLLNYVEHLAP